MRNRKDFIDLEILPTLGGYASDYDIDGIVDEVMDFDPVKGCVWKARFDELQPLHFEPDAYWEVVARHEAF